MLDEFSAFRARHNQGRGHLCAIGPRDGVWPKIVGSVGERGINLAQDSCAADTIRTDHNAIGIEEIRDRCPLAQKLRIRGDIKFLTLSSVAEDDLAYPVAGVN